MSIEPEEVEAEGIDNDPYEPGADDFCPHCGKAYEEFGDLGCGFCDQRHPDFGVMP